MNGYYPIINTTHCLLNNSLPDYIGNSNQNNIGALANDSNGYGLLNDYPPCSIQTPDNINHNGLTVSDPPNATQKIMVF